jgi:hypothetical protein
MLVIKLDILFLPEDIRSLVIRSIDAKKYNVVEIHSDKNNSNKNFIIFEYDGDSIDNFKHMFEEDILAKDQKMDSFMVAQDTEAENTLAIFKKGDIEQFGLYACKHCGMIFNSNEERVLHERIHYFV